MAYEVDFTKVSTIGLESSPVAAALAGLRANEARYFKNKYGQAFVVEPAKKAKKLIDYVHRILKQDRDIVIESRPLEATELLPPLRSDAHCREGLAPMIQRTVTDPQLACDLAYRFATALDELYGLEFELLGVGLLLLWHTLLLR